ncbi:DnaJ domain-containing protein [Chloroflexota bacterium]
MTNLKRGIVKRDYYEILGVPRSANQETIKKAYRTLAMQYHPDRNPGKEKWANEKFKEINEAFSVLGEPEKRRQYDHFGTVGNIGNIFGSPYTRTTFENVIKDFGGSGLGFDFLDDIFSDFLKGRGFSFRTFSRGSGPEQTWSQSPRGINLENLFGRAQPPPSQSVRYEVTITRKQAAKGMETDLTRRGKRLRVKIPAGVKNGSKVKLRNAQNITDGEPGDIVILVKVK